MNSTNIWTVDIETSPCIVMVWQLGKQYVTKEQLIEDWHIMAFTAKKLDSKDPPIYMETRTNKDLSLLKKLWHIFNAADVIITQNGKKFDEPKIKAQMMLAGLKPYKPFKHYDTFEQNTDKEFTSHSLDYMSQKFCTKFKKLKHKLFSGLSLWKECLGIKITYCPNPKAWKEMKTYNIHDVLSTEELYLKTRGWSKSTAPVLYRDNGVCPSCGSSSICKEGWNPSKLYRTQQLRCRNCGKWFSGQREKINVEKD